MAKRANGITREHRKPLIKLLDAVGDASTHAELTAAITTLLNSPMMTPHLLTYLRTEWFPLNKLKVTHHNIYFKQNQPLRGLGLWGWGIGLVLHLDYFPLQGLYIAY